MATKQSFFLNSNIQRETHYGELTSLKRNAEITDRYKQGDIARALAEGILKV
jgi:hypothetical protein